jgi:hypothetical protein
MVNALGKRFLQNPLPQMQIFRDILEQPVHVLYRIVHQSFFVNRSIIKFSLPRLSSQNTNATYMDVSNKKFNGKWKLKPCLERMR